MLEIDPSTLMHAIHSVLSLDCTNCRGEYKEPILAVHDVGKSTVPS
jgi:hypothetical protein